MMPAPGMNEPTAAGDARQRCLANLLQPLGFGVVILAMSCSEKVWLTL